MITMLVLNVHNPVSGGKYTLATIRAHDVRRAIGDMDALLDSPNGLGRLTIVSALQRGCAHAVLRLNGVDNPALAAKELAEIGSFCQLALTCLATSARFDIVVHTTP